MSGQSIELIRYEPKRMPEKPDTLGSYPLVVRARGINVPSEVFIYHAINSENPYSGDLFEAVATPSQIEELPKNKPTFNADTNDGTPFYRRNQLEVYFRSLSELHDFWEELKEQVNDLVENYKVMDSMVNTKIAVLSGSGADDITTIEQPSSYITLYSDPATTKDLDDNKNIVVPSVDSFGWLPVSPGHPHHAPPNARLFYNIGKHYEIRQVWESGGPAHDGLKEPYTLHSLNINGYDYSQGANGIYIINQDGIFWLDFDPDDFSDDTLNLPKPPRNPWPDDYFVGYGSSNPSVIRLLLFT